MNPQIVVSCGVARKCLRDLLPRQPPHPHDQHLRLQNHHHNQLRLSQNKAQLRMESSHSNSKLPLDFTCSLSLCPGSFSTRLLPTARQRVDSFQSTFTWAHHLRLYWDLHLFVLPLCQPQTIPWYSLSGSFTENRSTVAGHQGSRRQ